MHPESVPVFLNPVAGRGKAREYGEPIVRILESSGVRCELIESVAAGDIEQRIAAAVNSDVRRLIVAGGDGSVHEAVNGILGAGGKTALGVIPIGTGNDFAKACSIPLNWQDAGTELAHRIAGGSPPRLLDAGRMNERFFANGVGIGFDAKINRIAAKYNWPIGDLVYLFAVFEGLWDGVITPSVSMRYGDHQYDGPVTLASISNGPWVGGMFHMAPMARNDDGHFDLVFARPVTRRRILALLPKLMKGTHIGEPDIGYAPVRELELIAEDPVPSHLDGEAQPLQKEFKISLLKQALKLL